MVLTLATTRIRINSSSLDHPVVILADQSLEIVEIAKTLYCTKVVRLAYWLNIPSMRVDPLLSASEKMVLTLATTRFASIRRVWTIQ